MKHLIEHIEQREQLCEEKLTQDWLKGVRKWWVDWFRRRKKAFPTGSGKKKRDLDQNILAVAMSVSDKYTTQWVKDFSVKMAYTLDAVDTKFYQIINYLNRVIAEKKYLAKEDKNSDYKLWEVFDGEIRPMLDTIDRLMRKDVFNLLKKVEKEILQLYRAAQKAGATVLRHADDLEQEMLPELSVWRGLIPRRCVGLKRRMGVCRKKFVEMVIPPDTQVVVMTTKEKGKYGRYIAEILFHDDNGGLMNLSNLLLEKGLAEQ